MTIRGHKTYRADFFSYNEGDFFVTICTQNRVHHLGEIINAEMFLSDIGEFAYSQLLRVNEFRNNVHVPVFCVMPNHLHLIVQIDLSDTRDESDNAQCSPDPLFRTNSEEKRRVTELAKYINSFKGAVTKYANKRGLDFEWQDRFYDHRIRNPKEGNHIAEYIQNNVIKWDMDTFNDVD